LKCGADKYSSKEEVEKDNSKESAPAYLGAVKIWEEPKK